MHIRLSVLLACLLSMPAWAATLNVPSQFATIAAAEAAAVDGDTIKIAKGRYNEAVTTAKMLSFVGGKGTIWDGFDGMDQLVATANNVTVSGIEFQLGDLPVSITGDNATVTKCIFNGSDEGVFIDGANATVTGNRFQGLNNSSDTFAIEVTGPNALVDKNDMSYCYMFGIFVDAESLGGATVTGNIMDTNQYYGRIEVANATAPVVSKNRISNCYADDDLILVGGDDAKVESNILENVSYGIVSGITVNGDRALVNKNRLVNLYNYSSDFTCIQVNGQDAQATGNWIRKCGAGSDSDGVGIYVVGHNAMLLANGVVGLSGAGGFSDSVGIHVVGNNAMLKANRVVDLGGGGEESTALWIDGNDGTIANNIVDTIMDEYCYGIYVSGDRATIDRNQLYRLLYESFIEVDGDDFVISGNKIAHGAYACIGIVASGSATGSGLARIEKNTISNLSETAIELSGDGVMLTGNKVTKIADYGIDITGSDNTLSGNLVTRTYDDAFQISGDNNILSANRAFVGSKDGFDINSGDANTLNKCSASGYVGEGLDNGGTNTTATGCKFSNNRIDYAGAGNMADDTGTTFGTGGPAQAQEVD
ncbi:MAG: hypothetical protein AMXMBFR7_24050 [Planctomycetota bacterium]